ncbi:hypothetical protein QE152_g4316 [Popillia japonica]|uniref:Uncharacterized protein n=1 Tax=Popillia japonica TaxID=7064 RepID=A0AAW1MZ23_POPJA
MSGILQLSIDTSRFKEDISGPKSDCVPKLATQHCMDPILLQGTHCKNESVPKLATQHCMDPILLQGTHCKNESVG